MLRPNRKFRQKARYISCFLDHAVRAQVVASWQARLATLSRNLSEAPAAQDAWIWKVQCHIFEYLLRRYGDGRMSVAANSQPHFGPPNLPRGVRAISRSEIFELVHGVRGRGKDAPSFQSNRAHPHSIVKANQERYKLLPLFRQSPTSTWQEDLCTLVFRSIQLLRHWCDRVKRISI